MEPLRCKMCNGPLVLDDSGDYAVCEYCGTKHTRETIQKIMKVEVTNPVRIQEESIEEKLEKVKTFMNLGQRDEALVLCKTIVEKYPNDYRGWWYQYIVGTNELEKERGYEYLEIYDATLKVERIMQKFDSSIYNKTRPILDAIKSATINYNSIHKKLLGYGLSMYKYNQQYMISGCVFFAAGFIMFIVFRDFILLKGIAIILLIIGGLFILSESIHKSKDNAAEASLAQAENEARQKLEQIRLEYDLYSLKKR